MHENPYESPLSDIADVPRRRRWPWIALFLFAGAMLSLFVLRFYQAIHNGAGEETFNRLTIWGSGLAGMVLWSAYRFARP
jgi:type VI protein secretion system component VasK